MIHIFYTQVKNCVQIVDYIQILGFDYFKPKTPVFF